MAAKPIPDGYHSVTPNLVVAGAAKLIDFTTRAFGAHCDTAWKTPMAPSCMRRSRSATRS